MVVCPAGGWSVVGWREGGADWCLWYFYQVFVGGTQVGPVGKVVPFPLVFAIATIVTTFAAERGKLDELKKDSRDILHKANRVGALAG